MWIETQKCGPIGSGLQQLLPQFLDFPEGLCSIHLSDWIEVENAFVISVWDFTSQQKQCFMAYSESSDYVVSDE